MSEWIGYSSFLRGDRVVGTHVRGSGSLHDILASDRHWRSRTDLDDWTKHDLMVLEMQMEDYGLTGEIPTVGNLRDDGPLDWSAD
jgi:hypothetical protein